MCDISIAVNILYTRPTAHILFFAKPSFARAFKRLICFGLQNKGIAFIAWNSLPPFACCININFNPSFFKLLQAFIFLDTVRASTEKQLLWFFPRLEQWGFGQARTLPEVQNFQRKRVPELGRQSCQATAFCQVQNSQPVHATDALRQACKSFEATEA